MRFKKKIPILFPPGSLFAPETEVIADPYGSYTGIPEEPLEMPVQDVDDL